MSEKENYQRHIEQAIQNVLKKVKNPEFKGAERHPPEHTQASNSPTAAELAQARPVAVKHRAPRAANTLSKARPVSSRASRTQPLEKDSVPTPAETPTEQASEDISTTELSRETHSLIEGSDLYTPNILEPTEELPDIEEDPYEAPYNLFEEFVETELDILLSRYVDLCHCSQCRADIVALSLQQLPAYYVTGTRGTLTAKSVVWTKYMQEVMDAVTKAIHIVYKRPRSSCKRVRHMLWVKPDLEEVGSAPAGEQFAQTLTEESPPDLDLSEEITEIIKALEQESTPELLPVFSDLAHARTVQQAYTRGQETEEPEATEPEDMQLLEIEDWE